MNQRERIIDYIMNFGSITSYEAYIDLGITQLATRIKELKEQGYTFVTEWETRKNRYGKNVSFKKYKLGGINERLDREQEKHLCNIGS